ncbi:MAG: flagellar biosynthesis protein FlhF [Clostridia bacterium]|jgi:flagellar biosynthesis protein FlhF|nr:flagellar biosynthesis protein FlhF [Clostridia bacterium]
MRVKRYVATDIQEAMAKIKSEMGNEAVILHTRYFKEGGILGLFRKSFVEVTAALETRQPDILSKTQFPPKIPESPNFPGQRLYPPAQPLPAQPVQAQAAYRIHPAFPPPPQPAPAETEKESLPRVAQQMLERLRHQGLEEKLALKIIKASLQISNTEQGVSKEQLAEAVFNNLHNAIRNRCKPLTFSKNRRTAPKVFAMVGPTGVGKTTTIAKLAALYGLLEKKKVAFVTVDTYRIAAVEQLKTIADIMNFPVTVVYSLNELEQYLMDLGDTDIVFIDTAGRSHKNDLQIEELRNYLEIARPDEIFLALSSAGKYEDSLEIMNVYKELNITRLIFTKLDETSYYGSIFNIIYKSKFPLTYVTTGQCIPDDIEPANPVKLVQMLMKE